MSNQDFDQFWAEIEEGRKKDPWLPWEIVCKIFKGAQRIVVFPGQVFKSVAGVDHPVSQEAGESLIHHLQEGKSLKYPRSKHGVPIIYAGTKEQ
jgi:hypothetical protein